MIVIDATPLQTEHRYRGIGSYTAYLTMALIDLMGQRETLGLLLQHNQSADAAEITRLLDHSMVERVPLRRPTWRRSRLTWLIGAIGVSAALRQAKADLYHATDPSGLVNTRGIPTLTTLYDLIPLHFPERFLPTRQLDRRVGYAWYLAHLRKADHIIAISEATKWEAVERLRIAPERISVTPLGVDAARFAPPEPAIASAVRARHGLEGPYFLYAGSADPHKNVARLVKAFGQAGSVLPAECVLAIAGKWPPQDVAAIETMHLERGGRAEALRFLGFVPGEDLPALYERALAFVYPSLIEGFGLPVLEAMATGAAVITSTVSSLPEAAGDAALLVDPRDEDAIAAALVRVANDAELRAELRQRGLERAAAFTWSRTAEDTLHAYEHVLNRSL